MARPGKPSQPTLVVHPENNLSISWNAPADAEGAELTYILQLRSCDRNKVLAEMPIVNATSYTLSLNGLDPDSYEFIVFAENPAGHRSDASDRSNMKTIPDNRFTTREKRGGIVVEKVWREQDKVYLERRDSWIKDITCTVNHKLIVLDGTTNIKVYNLQDRRVDDPILIPVGNDLGPLLTPCQIATKMDSPNDFFITYEGNNVRKYSTDGRSMGKVWQDEMQSRYLHGLAIDHAGTLYAGGERLLRKDQHGTTTLQTPNKPPIHPMFISTFTAANGETREENKVIVADPFTIPAILTPGLPPKAPTYLECHSGVSGLFFSQVHGKIYIVSRYEIQCYEPDGTFLGNCDSEAHNRIPTVTCLTMTADGTKLIVGTTKGFCVIYTLQE